MESNRASHHVYVQQICSLSHPHIFSGPWYSWPIMIYSFIIPFFKKKNQKIQKLVCFLSFKTRTGKMEKTELNKKPNDFEQESQKTL